MATQVRMVLFVIVVVLLIPCSLGCIDDSGSAPGISINTTNSSNLAISEEKDVPLYIYPLIKGGLNKEEALRFDKIYHNRLAPYDSTDVLFAKYWILMPLTSNTLLKRFGSVNVTVEYLEVINETVSNVEQQDHSISSFILNHPEIVAELLYNDTSREILRLYLESPEIIEELIEHSKEDAVQVGRVLIDKIKNGELTKENALNIIRNIKVIKEVNPNALLDKPEVLWPPFKLRNKTVYYFNKPFIKLGKLPEPGCFGFEILWDPITETLLGRQYVMFLIHNKYLESGDYNTLNFTAFPTSGESLEITITESGLSHRYKNLAEIKIYRIPRFVYPIIEVNSTIIFEEAAHDIKDIWVESGFWPPADWEGILLKTHEKVIYQSLMEHSGHYFKYSDFKYIEPGGYIITTNSTIGVNRALVLKSSKYLKQGLWVNINISAILWVAQDYGYRSMELSVYNIETHNVPIIHSGSAFNINYYVIIVKNADQLEDILEYLEDFGN